MEEKRRRWQREVLYHLAILMSRRPDSFFRFYRASPASPCKTLPNVSSLQSPPVSDGLPSFHPIPFSRLMLHRSSADSNQGNFHVNVANALFDAARCLPAKPLFLCLAFICFTSSSYKGLVTVEHVFLAYVLILTS
jgi:hypothetical protein